MLHWYGFHLPRHRLPLCDVIQACVPEHLQNSLQLAFRRVLWMVWFSQLTPLETGRLIARCKSLRVCCDCAAWSK